MKGANSQTRETIKVMMWLLMQPNAYPMSQ